MKKLYLVPEVEDHGSSSFHSEVTPFHKMALFDAIHSPSDMNHM
jgi:hypothetical protein